MEDGQSFEKRSRGSLEDLSSARNPCRHTRRCEKRSYRGDETYERGPKFSKRWLSDDPFRNKGERVSVERVTCRQPYVSWRRERREREGRGYAAATSGTRFRGRDGGQCTTPAPPREERRDGVEGKEGRREERSVRAR